MRMKYQSLFILIVVFALVGLPVVAQEVEPGTGGIFIVSNPGGDPNFLNPLLANSTAELGVNWFMFPGLYNLDPVTNLPTTEVTNDEFFGLATGWTVSDDGLVYTFTLRDDLVWSDGTPVTANDYKFTYDALASEVVASPRTNVLATIASVEAPDATTLVITLADASCRGIDELDDFGILPEHHIRPMIETASGVDYSLINELPYNKEPDVTSGIFSFVANIPGDQISLGNNPNHVNPVLPEGYIYKNIPDQTVIVEQFLAGDINVVYDTGVPVERYEELRQMGQAGEIQFYEYVDDGYTWMAFNLADPANPQNGVDEDGNVIDQGHHPVFGDKRVRQSVAYGVNMEDIIQGALFGEATPAVAHTFPAAWANNPDLLPYPFEPETAMTLLDEAGWIDDDGDPATPRVASEDALYAEPGTQLSFLLQVDASDQARVNAATIIQDQLGDIGFDVRVESVDFSALIPVLLGQTYDAIIIGWTNISPDTDARAQFNPEFDVVGSGFNFVSMNNPEMSDLMEQARLLPGCDPEARAELYHQVQAIQHEELPYLFMYSQKNVIAVRGDVLNFAPHAENLFHNLGSWATIIG